MKKKLLLLFFIAVTVCVAIYCYVYKDHRDIATESADFSTTIPNLQNEFIANDSIANLKYQDKTIQITGNLTSVDIESKAIVVDGKVYASFLKIVPTNLTVGKSIKIKGRFLGYDDLVEEFKIDQTTIVE